MKRMCLLTLLLGLICETFCQSKLSKAIYPEVGKLMPYFELKEVSYYTKKQVSRNDFKGKWLVLDFWNEYCTACIKSFFETNSLQREFKNQIQFMLIGYTGSQYSISKRSSNKTVRTLYERIRNKQNLSLAIAYDSSLFHKFKITGCPFIVVVDPNGIVRGITYTIKEDNIKEFLTGKTPALPRPDLAFNNSLPFLTYNNGGPDTCFLFRSLISLWDPSTMSSQIKSDIFSSSSKGKFEVFGVSIEELYKYAYFGKTFWEPTDSAYKYLYPKVSFASSNSSIFQREDDLNQNRFCYSLIVPPNKASRSYLMEVMQRDLKTYFDFNADVELRRVRYWKLVSIDSSNTRLKTKSERRSFYTTPNAGFKAKKVPLSSVINCIWAANQDEAPFIDDTGINYDIDISLDCIMTDLEDVKRALNENGLDLVKGEKEMKVIVIRDPKE